VRKWLKRKQLSFSGAQKSAQEYENKGLNYSGGLQVAGAEFQIGNFCRTPGSFRKSGKQKGCGIRKMKEH